MRAVFPVAMLAGLAATASAAFAAPAPTIAVGSNPNAIVVSSAQSRAYVANDGSVSVVNLNTHLQTAEISTTVNHGQTAIGLYRHGTKAYIGDFALGTMVSFNTRTHAVKPGIPVGRGVSDMAAASNGFAYISEFAQSGAVGRVKIVRTLTDAVAKTIVLPSGAGTLTTRPNKRTIWVGSVESGRIWVISTHTNTVVRRLAVAKSGPVQGIAFTPNDKQVWVAGLGGVSVLDRATGKLVHFIPTTSVFPANPPFTPGPILVNTTGSRALVLNTATQTGTQGSVVSINTKTFKRTSSVLLGNEPTSFAIDPADNLVLATNFLDDTVSYFTARYPYRIQPEVRDLAGAGRSRRTG
jgi:DNA-binding beta-propeller fold protein YncE